MHLRQATAMVKESKNFRKDVLGDVRRELGGGEPRPAWDHGANGRALTNRDATQTLYSLYPSAVRNWISARGGLGPQMIFLRGKELMSMYRPCYLDAQASSPH